MSKVSAAIKSLRYLGRRLVRGSAGTLVNGEFQVPDWDSYAMNPGEPFKAIESIEKETRVVGQALAVLRSQGILAKEIYDQAKYLEMRDAIRSKFEIPWTAISPRVQRLIYAINAIRQPQVMIAAGVFCGNTFMSNAGAAVGPGAVYVARALVGLEILPLEGARAERNIRLLDTSGVGRIVVADAVHFCREWQDSIDLLYLDADGDKGRGKAIYKEIMESAWDKMPAGALLLAHNSVNSRREMAAYLDFVRNPRNCRSSVNVVLDAEGLEVSIK